ncbi:type VI secretion protein [Streptomyces sp. NPDC049954]|uniref:type VI secretion protein n=1 Tax=Streptomyces sp. NPDC049954 TaxID=3155779 RepID=UPI00342093E3
MNEQRKPSSGGAGQARSTVSDGLLLGVLGLILGVTVLVWIATGLAALLAHGDWPAAVSFTHTPQALRRLLQSPQDLPAAWPDAPKGSLSGYGLFWGLLLGLLMVLAVLAVFVLGTAARWRARRRTPAATTPHARAQEPERAPRTVALEKEPDHETPRPTPRPSPTGTPTPPVTPPEREEPSPPADVPAAAVPFPAPRGPLFLGPPGDRAPVAIEAVRDAEGAALVVTSDPAVWEETRDARAKLGPVLVYDPSHLCDTPARLHWSPSAGCVDRTTAAHRATALLAPVRPASLLDAATADTAETLLRCFLHAADVDGRPFKHVHRWAQGNQLQDAVRILRTHPAATSGTAGELESALTAYPERRDLAQKLTARALSALSSVHIRESCVPNRTDTASVESFLAEEGTLYVVGESIEDPKSRPGAMPLHTALASSVVEHGRRMAARSSSGRLDPPLTLVLDDVAAVAPLPQLPELLASGPALGLPTLALLRSREQARARWPHAELPA